MVSLVLVVSMAGKMRLAALESNKGVPGTFAGVDGKVYRRIGWNRLEDGRLGDIVEVYEEQKA